MQTNSRISDIEVLRAIAVLFVIYQHLRNLFPWKIPGFNELYASAGGGFGVDLFFAVSGFVIARDLIPRLSGASGWRERSRVMGAFWLRRIWRLWPAAWLWLALILFLVLVFNASGAFGTLTANLEATVAGVFNFANIRFAQTFMRSEYGASFVYWSLSLEEQFYLLFPLLILLFHRHLVWLLLAVALLQIVTPRQHPYLMMFRTDALAFGVLLAIWSQRASWRSAGEYLLHLGRGGCQLLLIAGVTTMAMLSTPNSPTRYGVGIIAMISAILVFIAAHDRDLLLQSGRVKGLFIWLGERSYALYLIHVPTFFLVRELFYRLDPAQPFSSGLAVAYVACALPLLLVLTELNFRLVERPLRRYGVGLSQRLLSPNSAAEGPIIVPVEPRHPG